MNPRVGAAALLSLGAANLLALLAAAVAAALYARWLDAPALALWASALALARGGQLLLDGGLKTALVRRDGLPDDATLARLGRWCAAVAAMLTGAVLLLAAWQWHRGRLDPGQALLLGVYPAAYFLTYPAMFTALARLERAHRFAAVGRAEGASVLVEFALPALAIAAGTPAWLAFTVAVALARSLRCAWIRRAAHRLEVAVRAAVPPAGGPGLRAVLGEGLGVQAVAALSMLRDQTHLWLLGPWFGAHWAGSYTLAMTACALLSQASVQTASRVALPLLRAATPQARWQRVLAQTRLLALCTLPPLALLPAALAHADAAWWGGRWADAVTLAPWLALRMVAGVATTTLGAWLMVARTPWASARAHAAWTACEIAAAAAALACWGPLGLAIAGAASAWAGVFVFLAMAAPGRSPWPRLRALLPLLLARPSAAAALLLALAVHAVPAVLPLAAAGLPLAWLAEPSVRRWLLRRRHSPIVPPRPHEAR